MTLLLDFPQALEAAGVNVRTLSGWEQPARSGYYYREGAGGPDADPAGHMHHHTASGSYQPNREKASAWAGLSLNGSDRLYQKRYDPDGTYEAVYTVANAYPAPISSGTGDRTVLERVRVGTEVLGRQGQDTPNWHGNTHYWNTEYVLDGTGSPVDRAVWEMMIVVCQVQNDLMGWGPNMHICHAHHTRRKVDLWAGQFSDSNRDGFDKTIEALRQDMAGPPPPGEDEMRNGDTGPNVQKWQNYLNRWNTEYGRGHTPLTEDGNYGPATEDRTLEFQQWAGIEHTGRCAYFDAATMAVAIGPDTGLDEPVA